ncbi:hypothetical protein [Moraxella lacunata]|uniref:hypothetical protein n=1 Tax=Moraxella lacunata TaxID=477 RepID=UPI003EE07560
MALQPVRATANRASRLRCFIKIPCQNKKLSIITPNSCKNHTDFSYRTNVKPIPLFSSIWGSDCHICLKSSVTVG